MGDSGVRGASNSIRPEPSPKKVARMPSDGTVSSPDGGWPRMADHCGTAS